MHSKLICSKHGGSATIKISQLRFLHKKAEMHNFPAHYFLFIGTPVGARLGEKKVK